MEHYPKEKSEIINIPETDRERPIPPDYIPEPKKHETIPSPEKEENSETNDKSHRSY